MLRLHEVADHSGLPLASVGPGLLVGGVGGNDLAPQDDIERSGGLGDGISEHSEPPYGTSWAPRAPFHCLYDITTEWKIQQLFYLLLDVIRLKAQKADFTPLYL